MIPALSGASNAYLPANRFAMGSALYTTGRQIGAAHRAWPSSVRCRPAAPGVDGYQHSYWYVAGVVALAAGMMMLTYRTPDRSALAAAAAPSPA